MKLIEDYIVSSAYDFPMPSKVFRDIIREANIEDLGSEDEVIDGLIEKFGSDYDLIVRCINIQYPSNKYFKVIDRREDDFRVRVWEWEMEMSFGEAKNIIYDYLSINLDSDIQILGEDHPYNDTTIGEIKKAFNLLKYNYNWFGGQ